MNTWRILDGSMRGVLSPCIPGRCGICRPRPIPESGAQRLFLLFLVYRHRHQQPRPINKSPDFLCRRRYLAIAFIFINDNTN